MDHQNIKMENILHEIFDCLSNGNSCNHLEDGEILDEEYDTEVGESTERNTELKVSKENCLEEVAIQKIVEAVNEEDILCVGRGTNNPDLSNFHDSENKVDEDLEDGEILDEEYDTDLSQLAESSKRNAKLKKSKKNCLGEGAKQKKIEYSWDMDQRHQQSSHRQLIHAPLHNNFSGFNNNRSRNRISLNKRVITKRDLSYQRDDDRGRKRLKVDQNDYDNKKTNEEERCTFVHRELTCKYHTGMKCHSGIDCRFSHSKLNEEQHRKILKNNLEKKPLLSMQTYDQPFFDDISDDDEFHGKSQFFQFSQITYCGLVIDEENFQNDVKDQLLPEKQNEPLNNNGNSYKSEVDDDLKDGVVFNEKDNTNKTKSSEYNTKTKESKEHCLTKEKKYFMLPCEVSVRDYSDIPLTMGVDDPRLRNNILAAKDPRPIQNFTIQGPLLLTPNPLQPSPVDIDMRQMLPPTMTYPQTMAILNDSRRKPHVPRDPRLQRRRFDVDQRLNNLQFFLN
ncbi:hypothetical protein AGLY_011201 [Aphis glycines]|uniref:C3H1-type domain-containing protein n=1 Tax=Aphis glycines TaxID=307491 RepID=A0A6G0TCY7_APHGL|nr:hypothetical protein AGLY_011201 [Aphis glycines]